MDYHVNRSIKRSSTKSFTNFKETAVVLACIYNKNNTIITHDFLYSLFSPYGNILRILIFEKLKVWKAFIEFDTIEAANHSKRDLNNLMVFDDGSRINIYFSNLETIKFQNNNSGGIDYTLQNNTKNSMISTLSDSIASIDSTSINRKNKDCNTERHILCISDQDDREDDILNIINNSTKHLQSEPILNYDEDETDCEERETDQFKAFLNYDKPFLLNLNSTTIKNTNTPPSNSSTFRLSTSEIPNIQDQKDVFSATKSEQKIFFNSSPNLILNTPPSILSSFTTAHNPLVSQMNSSQHMHLNAQVPEFGQQLPFSHMRILPQENVLQKPPGLGDQKDSDDDSDKLSFLSPDESLNNIQYQLYNNFRPFNSNDMEFANVNDSTKNLDHYSLAQLHQNLSILLGLSTKKSQVLYVGGLEHKDLKVKMIYNLFSNFGNILKIIFIRSKAAALIEFEKIEYSIISKDYLNNIPFLGSPLKVSNFFYVNFIKKYSILWDEYELMLIKIQAQRRLVILWQYFFHLPPSPNIMADFSSIF